MIVDLVRAPGGSRGARTRRRCAGQGRASSSSHCGDRPGWWSEIAPDQFTQVRCEAPRLGLCGPALPSPTSGGPVRAYRGGAARMAAPPRSSARARGRPGSGERTSMRSPGDRVLERQPLGVQELALEPEHARRGRTRGRRPPGGRSPAGARGSGACGRSRAAPAAACSPRQRALGLEVGDRVARPSSVSVEIRVRTRRSRPSGASIVPRARVGPALDEREVLARDLARAAARACSAAWTASERASTSSPRVSRSSRWTMPARGPRARRRRRRGSSAWTSVPGRVPARRVHDDARRLVDHQQVLVLPGDREARVGHVARPAPPRRPRPRSARRRAACGAWACASPSTRTRPASISRCAAAREPACAGEEDVEPLARRLGAATSIARHGAAAPRGRRAGAARRT